MNEKVSEKKNFKETSINEKKYVNNYHIDINDNKGDIIDEKIKPYVGILYYELIINQKPGKSNKIELEKINENIIDSRYNYYNSSNKNEKETYIILYRMACLNLIDYINKNFGSNYNLEIMNELGNYFLQMCDGKISSEELVENSKRILNVNYNYLLKDQIKYMYYIVIGFTVFIGFAYYSGEGNLDGYLLWAAKNLLGTGLIHYILNYLGKNAKNRKDFNKKYYLSYLLLFVLILIEV